MSGELQTRYREAFRMLRRSLEGLFVMTCGACADSPPPKSLDLNAHTWYSYSGDHPASGPWGIHFDGQWRRSDLGVTWQQFQMRPGVNYAWSDKLLLTAGYAFTRTYPYGDFPAREAFPEHRVYQQALVRQTFKSVPLQHRIRLEQRWIRYPSPETSTWTYQNRFRYLAKADVPLARRADGSTEWYLPISDEILIGVPPNYGPRPFDQNRFFVGMGWAGSGVNVELGYLNQFIGQRNGRIFESNHTFYFNAASTLPFSKFWD